MHTMPNRPGQVKSHWFIAFAAVAFMALSERAWAQTQVIHLLRADGLVDGATLKHVAENLKRLDERVLVSTDADYLKVRIDASIAYEVVLRALNAGPRQFQAAATASGTTAFPVRIDTGDPIGDDLRY
ncbi:MAG TPA: hypothetical protein PKY96_18750, partial [Flavobacteriales bacterium]|nr:hypothetical protein [Flavobacteriales bacterium]